MERAQSTDELANSKQDDQAEEIEALESVYHAVEAEIQRTADVKSKLRDYVEQEQREREKLLKLLLDVADRMESRSYALKAFTTSVTSSDTRPSSSDMLAQERETVAASLEEMRSQLLGVLARIGVTEDASVQVGQVADLDKCDGISAEDSEFEDYTVLRVIRRAYTYETKRFLGDDMVSERKVRKADVVLARKVGKTTTEYELASTGETPVSDSSVSGLTNCQSVDHARGK